MPVLAFISNKQPGTAKPATYIILFSTLITLAFFHALLIFALLYIVIFFLERKNVFASTRFLYIIAFIFFFAVLLKAIAFRTDYERHSMSGLKNFITLFPNYINLYSNKQFLLNCLTKYYWIPIISVGIVIVYSIRRAWINMLLFLSFFFGYLLLVNISYPTTATPPFYIENLYLPLSLFLALPFVFDVLPILEKKHLALPITAAIIISGCARIYAAHTTYTTRLDLERSFLDKYDDRKVIVKAGKKDLDILQMLWGTPYEFLLLSEIERDKAASIIIDEYPQHLAWANDLKKELLVNWNIIPYNQINPKYFHFTDTTTGYSVDLAPMH